MKFSIPLPRLMRWLFALLSALSVLGAVAIATVLAVNPPDAPWHAMGLDTMRFHPAAGVMTLRPQPVGPEVTVTRIGTRPQANPMVDEAAAHQIRRVILAMELVYAVYFALLFDLMRRMFRNVQDGQSFTVRTLRLVRLVGLLLLVFALVSSSVETWACQTLVSYFCGHVDAMQTQSWLVQVRDPNIPFGGSALFYGLLILALSEVFAQGLALKQENDLTV